MSCCTYYRAGARPTSPQAPQEPPPPSEFMCQICGFLMEDPVITAVGHTLDRACIEACMELGHIPSAGIVPNLNIKAAIMSWCARAGHRPPFPVSRQEARRIVELFMASGDKPSQHNQEDEEARGGCDQEEGLFMELTDPRDSAKMEAIEELFGRIQTIGDRAAACNPRTMAAIVPMLWSGYDRAIEAVMELAKEPANALPIAGCGSVPPLLLALADADSDESTRAHAACALGPLAEEGRSGLRIMEALGAAATLREAFCRDKLLTGDADLDSDARSSSGTALGSLIRRDAAGLIGVPADTKEAKSARAA